jgi:SAM-dependent methyltransferase
LEAGDFYERAEVIHEVVEAKRSEISYNVISDLAARNVSCKKGSLLDIGCGDGSFVARFKRRCEVIGIDVSQRAVALAKRTGIDARRVDISCEVLPFEDQYFDVVYMGDIIEHLLNPDFAITEVFRVTRSKGFLVLSTPNLASWLNRLLLLFGMQPLFSEVSTVRHFGRHGRRDFTPVGHLRLFTCNALKEFLTYYGFTITRLEGAPHEGLPVFLKQSDNIISRIPSLASIIIVAAQKSC